MKISTEIKKYISYGLLIVMVSAMIFVIISIIKSAYLYQYDNDEFYHVQRVYLIASGFKPYTSFFFIFSNIFHTLLVPLFIFFGFSFATLAKARIFMIVLFAIRVILIALIINKIFNRRVALIFIPLFLFDPFTIFSSMQIRPDNLMMTIYSLGMFIFILGFFKSSKFLLFVSGVAFGLSSLILIKIAPQLLILLIAYCFYCIRYRKFKDFLFFIDGLGLSLFVFCFYHLVNGSFFPMFKQVFIFSFTLSNLIINQVSYGFFHQPNNGFIYGLMGKPLTWMYVWILPLLAGIGAYLTLSSSNKEQEKIEIINNKKKQLIQMTLVASLVIQYIFLLYLNTVFIQYYIPFQWLLALFAAVMIDDLIFIQFKSVIFHQLITICLIAIFFALSYVSVQANNARTFFRTEYQISQFAPIWSKVPKDSAIFPNILFRRIVYPITEQYNQENYDYFYSSMGNMVPSYIGSFEKNKLPFLIIDNPETFYTLEPGMEKYVKDHFQKIDGQINLYKRVK